jgi:hypothetical protein
LELQHTSLIDKYVGAIALHSVRPEMLVVRKKLLCERNVPVNTSGAFDVLVPPLLAN